MTNCFCLKSFLRHALLLGIATTSILAYAQDTMDWQLLFENDETAIYVAGPLSREKMKADGISIRIHSKQAGSDMHALAKVGCEKQQFYMVIGMDMNPDAPIEDTWMLPPMKKFFLDAPKGSVYGRLREMVCGQ